MPLSDRHSRYDVEELLAQARMWREVSNDAEDPELRDLYLTRAADCERLVRRSTTVPAVALTAPKVTRFVSLQVANELHDTLIHGLRSKAVPVKVP
jgi:hypothetical protein